MLSLGGLSGQHKMSEHIGWIGLSLGGLSGQKVSEHKG